jgi:hypothetical protein
MSGDLASRALGSISGLPKAPAGRESTVGVLGGLRGALATTTLGIPADATTVSGCGLPAKAPAYGVIDGYLTYLAIPDSGVVQLPHPIGIRKVSFGSGYVVLHTAASDLMGRLCPAGQTETSRQAETTRRPANLP